MGVFDIFLIIIIVTCFFLKSKLHKQYLLLLLIIGIIFLQILLEPIRWSMYGLYFICLLYFLIIIGILSKQFIKKKIISISLAIIIIISIVLSILFPISQFSKPSGPYNVGTTIFEAIDLKRNDPYGQLTNRKISYRIWYPSDQHPSVSPVPWLLHGKEMAKEITKMLSFPSFSLNQTEHISSHSYWQTSVSSSSKSYPVVIISHGWQGFSELHTNWAELLASYGYIVVSIEHTHGSAATFFEDGSVIPYNQETLNFNVDELVFKRTSNILVNTYANDLIFVIDQLDEINKSDWLLAEKLDLTKIGVIGHSTGGGGAITAAIKDERIDCVFGCDPWVEPLYKEEMNLGLHIPTLYLRSEEWSEHSNNDNLYILIDNSSDFSGLYQIVNSKHIDFTMAYLFSPTTKYLGNNMFFRNDSFITIQQQFILSFFENNLIGETNSYQHIVNQYENDIITIRRGE